MFFALGVAVRRKLSKVHRLSADIKEWAYSLTGRSKLDASKHPDPNQYELVSVLVYVEIRDRLARLCPLTCR